MYYLSMTMLISTINFRIYIINSSYNLLILVYNGHKRNLHVKIVDHYTCAINLDNSGWSLIFGMCCAYTWSLLYPAILYSRNHATSVERGTYIYSYFFLIITTLVPFSKFNNSYYFYDISVSTMCISL